MKTSMLIAAVLFALAESRAEAGNANPGRAAYFKYCSACHGDDDEAMASPRPACNQNRRT